MTDTGSLLEITITYFLVQYTQPGVLSSSRKKLLQVPGYKITPYGSRSFSHVAPYLWNKLPDAIRQSPLLATFKSRLNMHLFNEAFNL